MKSCHSCFWCRIAFKDKWNYKCKMGKKFIFSRANYMNHSKLHGWFCKHYHFGGWDGPEKGGGR